MVRLLLFSLLCAWSCVRAENLEKKLLDDLLGSGYSPDARPVANSKDNVTVTVSMSLIKILSVNERDGSLVVAMYEAISWRDAGLVWSPESYNDLRKINIPTKSIWIPDIRVYNEKPGPGEIPTTERAVVTADGTVVFVPHSARDFLCTFDMTGFPFDNQTCQLKVGSWTYDGTQVDLRNPFSAVDSYTPHHSWKLESFTTRRNAVKYECCPESYIDLDFIIKIKRHSFYEYSLYVAPALLVLLSIPFIHGFVASQVLELTNAIAAIPIFILILMVEELFPSFDNASETPILLDLYLSCLKTLVASTILMALNKIITGSGIIDLCSKTMCHPHSPAHTIIGWLACICGVGEVEQSSHADGQQLPMINAEESGDGKEAASESLATLLQEVRQDRQARNTWMKVHMLIKRVFAIGLLIYCIIRAAQFPSL